MIRYSTFLLLCFSLLFGGQTAWAQASKPNKYASIIIDADSLEILHARQIDGARFPASLTKMMTLHLTFDALARGDIALGDSMRVSARAARTPPVKLGLRAGKTITVEQAIQALTVRSANDAAAVLAEHISGSESEFAYAMSMKAKALGMQSTAFKNPHGLPNSAQITTARDMAKLASSLLRRHRQYYHYFSQPSFRYGGRTYNNHNTLLSTVQGVDGFKTGFTNASGYNLAVSAKRDGHRIIAVVLGGASGKARDTHMADLIERGFEVIKTTKTQPNPAFALNANEVRRAAIRKVEPLPVQNQSFTLRAAHGTKNPTVRIIRGAKNIRIPAARPNAWAVQIGAYQSEDRARSAAATVKADPRLGLSQSQPTALAIARASGFIYRARLVGLSHENAAHTCKTLAARGQSCLVIAPT